MPHQNIALSRGTLIRIRKRIAEGIDPESDDEDNRELFPNRASRQPSFGGRLTPDAAMPIPIIKKLSPNPTLKQAFAEIRKRVRYYTEAFRLPPTSDPSGSITHEFSKVKSRLIFRIESFLDTLN